MNTWIFPSIGASGGWNTGHEACDRGMRLGKFAKTQSKRHSITTTHLFHTFIDIYTPVWHVEGFNCYEWIECQHVGATVKYSRLNIPEHITYSATNNWTRMDRIHG